MKTFAKLIGTMIFGAAIFLLAMWCIASVHGQIRQVSANHPIRVATLDDGTRCAYIHNGDGVALDCDWKTKHE